MPSVPPEDIARSAATLARSNSVRNALVWLITVVVLPAAGWAYAKLDTSKDMAAIRLSVDQLTTQQIELVSRVDKMSARVDARVNGLQRDVVVSSIAALAYETEANSKRKLEAGERLATDIYDAQVKALVDTTTAAFNTIHTAAVPHVTR